MSDILKALYNSLELLFEEEKNENLNIGNVKEFFNNFIVITIF